MVLGAKNARRLTPTALLVVVAALLLLACSDGDGDEGGDIAMETAAATATESGVTLVTPADPTIPADARPPTEADLMLAPVIRTREDVAMRFDATAEDVEVVSIVEREWPDSCLDVSYIGQEDEACAQVITPGYLIILQLAETVYQYHTDEAGDNVRFAGVDPG